jgi:hypothetical protein
MRRCLVSSFFADVTQHIHSLRARGVMLAHASQTVASDSIALRKSGGILCTVPEPIDWRAMIQKSTGQRRFRNSDAEPTGAIARCRALDPCTVECWGAALSNPRLPRDLPPPEPGVARRASSCSNASSNPLVLTEAIAWPSSPQYYSVRSNHSCGAPWSTFRDRPEVDMDNTSGIRLTRSGIIESPSLPFMLLCGSRTIEQPICWFLLVWRGPLRSRRGVRSFLSLSL